MIRDRFFHLSLAMAEWTAAAYPSGCHTRQLEKQQQEEDLRTWEDEGGNLASTEVPARACPAAAA